MLAAEVYKAPWKDNPMHLDAKAMVAVFDQYAKPLFGYALKLTEDHILADQIVGNVFAKLIEECAGGRGPDSNLRSYLYEMTYHKVIDEVRYTQRFGSLENSGLEHVQGIEKLVDHHLDMERVRDLMGKLSPDQRHVIILRLLEGFTIKETAEIMGKEINNVKVLQNRAVATLRKGMGYVDEDE